MTGTIRGAQIRNLTILDEDIGEYAAIEYIKLTNSYVWIEDFDGEASGVQFEAGVVADFWSTGGTNYDATKVLYAGGAGGTLEAITPGADNDSVFSIGLPIFRIDANPTVEVRFKILDIANAYVSVGFAEGSYADKGSPDDDICLVGIDSDSDDHLYFFSNDNGAGLVSDDCNVSITADTFVTIRIDLTNTEQPRVWINDAGGQVVAANEIAANLITGTVQAGISIAPYFMFQSLSAAADTFTIDYIKAWQDRV